MNPNSQTHRIVSLALAALLMLFQPAGIVLADTAPTGSTSPTTTTQTTDPTATTTPTAATTTSDPSTATSPTTTTTDPSTTTSPTTTTDPSASTTTPTTTTIPSSSTTSTPTTTSTTPTTTTSSTGAGTTGATNGPTGTIPKWAYNDATGKWGATNQSTFYWDPTNHIYASPLYWYDPAVGWYHVVQAPSASALAESSALSNGSLIPLDKLLGLSDPSISNTGPGSTNNASNTTTNNALFNFLVNALVTNNDTSTATSGNATASSNTNVGNVSSGAATVIQNLLNLLNAAWSWSNGGLSYFFQNLFGDHTGDIMIQPTATISGSGGSVGGLACTGGALSSISNSGPNSTNNASDTCGSNFTVNNQMNGAIDNNINLLAQSGDATASKNTLAGNVTSGAATTDLNILNMINSAINAGQSFFGLLNIFGNLNGDILFPDGFLNGVAPTGPVATGSNLATINGTGPGSTNNATIDQSNNLTINNTVGCGGGQPESLQQAAPSCFNNNITSTAQSGNASATNNTIAGSTSSGDASTQNNIFNLFNTSLFGDNAVLVLVNVMGNWFGHIMNLPDGGSSTGALLTGNAVVQENNTGPNSTNNASVSQTNNGTINNTVNGSITNDIKAGAVSGNATADSNTTVGNVTSGAANVATNIANIFGSSLNLKKWFGVLVVNVFGNWTGSVGQNTSAGDPPQLSAALVQLAASSNSQTGTAGASIFDNQPVVVNQGGSSGDGSASAGTVSSSFSAPVQSLVAAAHNTPVQLATKAANKATTLLIALAVFTMMLAGGALQLERRLK